MIGSAAACAWGRAGASWAGKQGEANTQGIGEPDDPDPAKLTARHPRARGRGITHLVAEVTTAGADHGRSGAVGGLDDLVVADRAPGLADRPQAPVHRELRPGGAREVGVAG